jgi:hypothetical protein
MEEGSAATALLRAEEASREAVAEDFTGAEAVAAPSTAAAGEGASTAGAVAGFMEVAAAMAVAVDERDSGMPLRRHLIQSVPGSRNTSPGGTA